MRLNREELAELACVLRGTRRTVASVLEELGLEMARYDLDEILDMLAEHEDTQRCAECREWAIMALEGERGDAIALCANCDEVDNSGEMPDESDPDAAERPGLDDLVDPDES